ncbi:WYL domain-containing protein [Terribacillus saccharophilus]|uniref:helix-turn-helix transcriptional regulator n=1 Tax=Terribacillus saccharophilus TaxID=361277 RepID=UPI003981DCE4
MSKSERLQSMLQYINEKKHFNLKDLMQEYGISRSTAIRDIQALELLGMPLYAEHGRNGKYVVLDNRILSPITFTSEELYAIYFAMMTLAGYKETPFKQEISSLEDTFQSVLPSAIKDRIEKMKHAVSLDTPNHRNEAAYLKEILKGILDEKVYTISYRKQNSSKKMTVQFITLQSRFSQWYAKVYNMDKQMIQNIRCDKVMNMIENDEVQSQSWDYLFSLVTTYHQRPDAIAFTVEVTERGKDLYEKENYPSMILNPTGNTFTICGHYHAEEELFIADYFLRFGTSILSVQPAELRNSIQKRILSIQNHVNGLI